MRLLFRDPEAADGGGEGEVPQGVRGGAGGGESQSQSQSATKKRKGESSSLGSEATAGVKAAKKAKTKRAESLGAQLLAAASRGEGGEKNGGKGDCDSDADGVEDYGSDGSEYSGDSDSALAECGITLR